MNNKKSIQGIIRDIDNLISENCTYSSPHFQKWYYKTDRFIMRYFGYSDEYRRWIEYHFGEDEPFEWTSFQIKEVLLQIRSDFEVYLEEIDDEEVNTPVHFSEKPFRNLDNSKIFIVHGHDGELKESVARILNKQGINEIILSEQANRGKTIIEKLEKYSDVGAAICLFTNDDVGRENNETELTPRARQNVVFEAGYFMGLLGREHVILISDIGNEIPGDLDGMVYTSSTDWKINLCKDLKEMGFNIDFNKLY